MTQEEMDFTSSFELKPRPDNARLTWCYGIVLWFETGFTARYCKEAQAILSTSPHCPKTHWSQTIFTFKEPIALTTVESIDDSSAPVGSRECPASTIRSRISIVRSSAHRSIDASIETTAVGSDGRKRSWPAQIFNLWSVFARAGSWISTLRRINLLFVAMGQVFDLQLHACIITIFIILFFESREKNGKVPIGW